MSDEACFDPASCKAAHEFSTERWRDFNWASSSLRHAQRAKPSKEKPGIFPLSFAGNCSDNRDQSCAAVSSPARSRFSPKDFANWAMLPRRTAVKTLPIRFLYPRTAHATNGQQLSDRFAEGRRGAESGYHFPRLTRHHQGRRWTSPLLVKSILAGLAFPSISVLAMQNHDNRAEQDREIERQALLFETVCQRQSAGISTPSRLARNDTPALASNHTHASETASKPPWPYGKHHASIAARRSPSRQPIAPSLSRRNGAVGRVPNSPGRLGRRCPIARQRQQ